MALTPEKLAEKKAAGMEDIRQHWRVENRDLINDGPTGWWNFQESTIIGTTAKVELNGFVILETDIAKVDPATFLYPLKQFTGLDNRKGHFGFNGHNDAVQFRAIRIKRLGGAPGRSPATRNGTSSSPAALRANGIAPRAARRRRRMKNLTQLLVLISMLGCVLGGGRASGEVSHSKPPTLQVPVTDSRPVIDGKLDEPCWQGAAATGPLKVAGAARGTSTTQAFILRDDGHLYVALRCAGELAETDARTAGEDTGGDPSASAEPPVPLPIRPGCFLSVTKGLPADPVLAALTVECWGRPRKLDAWQSLIGQHTSRNTGGLTPAVRRVTKGFTSPPSFPRPSRPSAG